MPREYYRQNAFAAGELSQKMWSRSDWDGYRMGAARMTNFIAMEEGGAELRPGIFRQAAAHQSASATASDRGRLIPFKRAVLENYVLEFSDLSLRIWDVSAGALVQFEGADLELVTPWPTKVLGRLNYTRRADVMIIFDSGREYKPYVLANRGNGFWTIIPFQFRNGPFMRPNLDITLSTGGGTLSASAPYFEAGHVGAQVWLRENPDSISTPKWQVDKNVAANDLREFSGLVYQALGAGTTGTAPPIHQQGTRSDGGVRWKYLHDGAAVVTITAVNSAINASYSLNAGEVMPSAAGSTKFWHMQAFNDHDGWPGASVFHQDRLYFASSVTEPDTLYGSVVSDYDDIGANFKQGLGNGEVTDSDGIRLPLADGSVDPVAWLLSADELYSGGASGTRKIRGSGRDDAISAASSIAKSTGTAGAALTTRPVRIGDFILFVGLGRRSLRALRLDGQEIEAIRHAEHLLINGIQEMAWEATTKTLWIVTVSGRLIAYKYEQAQGIEAPSPIIIHNNSLIESLCVVSRPDGIESVWMILRAFNADGTFQREVCLLSRRWRSGQSAESACYLDRAGYFDANAPVDPENPDDGAVDTPPPIQTGGTGSGDSGATDGGGYIFEPGTGGRFGEDGPETYL